MATNTTATQVNGYISGTGFTYARYDTSNLSPSSKSISGVRALIGTLNEQIFQIAPDSQTTPTVLGELETPSAITDSGYYVQVLKGYFLAPTTGNYIFRGLADDYLEVYLSSIKGSQEGINYSKPLIKSTSWYQSNSMSNYYLMNTPALTSSPIAMTAGDAYYMEVYHYNDGGAGSFKVSVEVPNTDDAYPNQVYEVQKIQVKPTIAE